MHSKCNIHNEMSMHMMPCRSFSSGNTRGVTVSLRNNRHVVTGEWKLAVGIDWRDIGIATLFLFLLGTIVVSQTMQVDLGTQEMGKRRRKK
jgi:hypothetical protein